MSTTIPVEINGTLYEAIHGLSYIRHRSLNRVERMVLEALAVASYNTGRLMAAASGGQLLTKEEEGLLQYLVISSLKAGAKKLDGRPPSG